MLNKKSVLITIIVLLSVFAPLTIVGLLAKGNVSPLEENPNHETFYQGYMYFYDSSDKFLSKYECVTEVCEYTSSTIDDTEYDGFNYYKDGSEKSVSLIENRYTFITDGSLIYLYAANTGTTLQTYKALKTYSTSIENNTYIVQNDKGVWGALSLGQALGPVLPFEYSFIGLINDVNADGTLNADKFVVKKDNSWYLVRSDSGEVDYVTEALNRPIIDYNDYYIFTKNGEMDNIHIYNYKGEEYLKELVIKEYIKVSDYTGIITDHILYLYKDFGTSAIRTYELTDGFKDVQLELKNNQIMIKINDKIVETVALD